MKKTIITVLVMMSLSSFVFAQSQISKVFNTDNSLLPENSLHALKIDANDNKWIGTNGGGLAILYEENESWAIYDTSNSDLPSNFIFDIAFTEREGTWVACFGGGVARYSEDCELREVYKTGGIANAVSIDVDIHNNKWIGTFTDGLFKLDEGELEHFTAENSPLTDNSIVSVTIDKDDNKWIVMSGKSGVNVLYADDTWRTYNKARTPELDASQVYEVSFWEEDVFFTTNNGLFILKADGTWKTVNQDNSCLPSNSLGRIAFYQNGDVLLGTGYPVLGFGNGFAYLKSDLSSSECTIYNASNSDLPNNTIADMAIDSQNNLWVGTRSTGNSGIGGLAMFSNGLMTHTEDIYLENDFKLHNYPNPCFDHTTIQYQLPQDEQDLVQLKLYNIHGRHIQTLVEERQPAFGSHQINLKTNHLPKGVYLYTLTYGTKVISKKMIVQ